MKKLVLVLALVAIIGAGTAFADHPSGWGLGFQGGGSIGWMGFPFNFGYGGAFTFKAPTVPIFWGISLDVSIWGIGIGLTADWYFLDLAIASNILHFYMGVGGALDVYFPFDIALLARLPIGLSVQIPIKSGIDALEFYFQIVPSAGLAFIPPRFAGGLGFDAGFRIWLK